MLEKLVVVTRKTRLAELVERFHTRGQVKFYLEHGGGDFAQYQAEDAAYQRSLATVRRALDLGLPQQYLDRSLVPTYRFAPTDVVVALGQDGLVANVAKYVRALPLVGVNPDPERYDGVLLPWRPAEAGRAVAGVLEGRALSRPVTLAEAVLNDGQRLLAFNDLFIGAGSHVSARYRLRVGDAVEAQSSSGVLVSTGAGSTGWLSSIFNMAERVAECTGGKGGHGLRLDWSDPRLVFVVREPFASKHSRAQVVFGMLEPGEHVILESQMPTDGVIFSDGVELDYLAFNSGAIATVGAAEQRARLVVA